MTCETERENREKEQSQSSLPSSQALSYHLLISAYTPVNTAQNQNGSFIYITSHQSVQDCMSASV